MSETEYEYGDLVGLGKTDKTAMVINPDPVSQSEAIRMVEEEGRDPDSFAEGDVVADEIAEKGAIVVRNGNKVFAVEEEGVLVIARKEDRDTDVPVLSESLRLGGRVDDEDLIQP